MSFLFIDTEFTDFNPMQLMSVGIVSEDGEHELYVEINDHNPNFRSAFVNEVVVPLMDMPKYGKTYAEAGAAVSEWIQSLPYPSVTIVVDYVGDYQLFEQLIQPSPCKKRIHYKMLNQGFLHMLHERGIHTPDRISNGYAALMNETPKYFEQDPRQHHALVDAKANRYGWLKGYEAAK